MLLLLFLNFETESYQAAGWIIYTKVGNTDTELRKLQPESIVLMGGKIELRQFCHNIVFLGKEKLFDYCQK
ncbi:hypothetical protein EGI32_11945 [Ferruginibacter sp. HRS2-29]|nr:hypothetical protein [Ferruginibacter sp. HRS2-29]